MGLRDVIGSWAGPDMMDALTADIARHVLSRDKDGLTSKLRYDKEYLFNFRVELLDGPLCVEPPVKTVIRICLVRIFK